VPGLAEAIRASKALKFMVCNVANQKGETQGYTCSDHIRTIERHISETHFDLIICNNKIPKEKTDGIEMVLPDAKLEEQYAIYYAPLTDKQNPWRHDPEKLAEVITDLFYERTGPLTSTRTDTMVKPA
jgi:uncharacterized cofD-like protein